MTTVSSFPISGGNNNAALWNSTLNEISSNFTASGLVASNGGALVLNIASGVAHCGGVRKVIDASTANMTNNTTNYVRFDPATDDYHVDTDDTAPTNSVVIARVVTSGGTISSITDMRVMVHASQRSSNRYFKW